MNTVAAPRTLIMWKNSPPKNTFIYVNVPILTSQRRPSKLTKKKLLINFITMDKIFKLIKAGGIS
jgi:hypothetical protein